MFNKQPFRLLARSRLMAVMATMNRALYQEPQAVFLVTNFSKLCQTAFSEKINEFCCCCKFLVCSCL